MFTIYAPHEAQDDAKIQALMHWIGEHGAPAIRAVDCGDHYEAIEGAHRLAACDGLGIAPHIIEMDADDVITDHDCEDLAECPAQEILDYFAQDQRVPYTFCR